MAKTRQLQKKVKCVKWWDFHNAMQLADADDISKVLNFFPVFFSLSRPFHSPLVVIMSQFNLLMTIRSYPLHLLNLNKFSSHFFCWDFGMMIERHICLFFKQKNACGCWRWKKYLKLKVRGSRVEENCEGEGFFKQQKKSFQEFYANFIHASIIISSVCFCSRRFFILHKITKFQLIPKKIKSNKNSR